MKRFCILISFILCLSVLTACTGQGNQTDGSLSADPGLEASPSEQSAGEELETERIPAGEEDPAWTTGRAGSPMYKMKESINRIGEEAVTVELYIDADVDSAGDIMYDDGQEMTLLIRQGEKAYPLIVNRYIQNGGISYRIIFDYDTQDFDLLVIQEQGAGLVIYEYRYLPEEEAFYRYTVYEATGNVDIYG